MRKRSTGLIELHDERESDGGFFCMQLASFINEEKNPGTPEYAELWEDRFAQAEAGECAYREKCYIYEKTLKRFAEKTVSLRKKKPNKDAIIQKPGDG